MASSTASAARSPLRSGLRALLLVAAALLAAGVLVIVPLAGWALLAPFAGVPVTVACVDSDSASPGGRSGPLAVEGDATVIAAAAGTTIAVVAGPDGRTAGGWAHVLADDRVVVSVPIASRAVAAGIDDGRVYLFDDKLGYFLDAATGEPLHDVFTVDNYRGLYLENGVERVQTTFLVGFVGLDEQPFLPRELPFGAVVDGCLVATAVER